MAEPTVLTLPESFEQAAAFQFVSTLGANKSAPKIEIDFSGLRFSYPFGMLIVAAELRQFASRRPPGTMFLRGLSAQNGAHTYLAHIGFFEHVGIDYGNKPGAASGGMSYVPITELRKNDLLQRQSNYGRPIGYAVEQEAQKLALVLTQKNDLSINRPVAYCIREIIRNTFEHGETAESVVCAQRWADGEIELGIIDRGRGVRRSLAERMATQSDVEALQLAIQPGVSRSVPAPDDNEWANSGFGLFVLSELGRKYGSFTICSGGAALVAEAGSVQQNDFAFDGTAVRLRIRKPKGANFEKLIQEIVIDGEARTAASEFPRRASKSSKTI